MVPLSAGMDARVGAPDHERHRPEQTLLYQLVEQHYPDFVTQLAVEGKVLPDYVHQEFEAYLKCGRLEHGFLRVQCDSCHAEQLVAFSCTNSRRLRRAPRILPELRCSRMAESAALLVDEVLPHRPMRQLSPWMACSRATQEQLPRVLSVPHPLRYLFASQPKLMGKVLGIVYRTLATHLIHKAGYKKSDAHTGSVTLIQRFGGALNLNIHLHMIFLDGVYVDRGDGELDRFRWVKAPTTAELSIYALWVQLTHTIAHRIGQYLERQGLLVREAEQSYPALDESEEDSMNQLQGHSITYRIAVGPHQGRKVFTLQTLPGTEEPFVDTVNGVAGFSLHASVAVKVSERKKLERICRYITRPAVSEKRLSLTRQGKVRYQLKTPYRDGTTHVIFEPVDFIAKLVALVPRPRVNLTRYHGVFVRGGLPHNSKHRALVTPARRGKGNRRNNTQEDKEKDATNRHVAMSWAQRLKRVFNINVERCRVCGGTARVIAAIEDKAVIEKILAHLNSKVSCTQTAPLPQVRAPPAAALFT